MTLWVEAESGRVYRIPEADWRAADAQSVTLSDLLGRTRRAGRAWVESYLLAAVEGAQAVLNDPAVRAALLGLAASSVPGADRWLVDAASATTAEAFVEALEEDGADAAGRLATLGQVIDRLDAGAGLERLGELAARAALLEMQAARGTAGNAAAPPTLALLLPVLARATREDPGWLEAARLTEVPAEDVAAATRAHVAARLPAPTAPTFDYAKLLGRPAVPPAPDPTDEAD